MTIRLSPGITQEQITGYLDKPTSLPLPEVCVWVYRFLRRNGSADRPTIEILGTYFNRKEAVEVAQTVLNVRYNNIYMERRAAIKSGDRLLLVDLRPLKESKWTP